MDIKVYGTPVLREKSTNLELHEINDELRATFEEMLDIMRKAQGIGIAANQVGINRRIFAIEIDGKIKKVVNPEILEFSEELDEEAEGCLSIPGIYKKVARPAYIKVKYLDENAVEHEEELEGLWAKAFQHESDHIAGMMFIDRVSKVNRRLIAKKLALLAKNPTPRIFD